MAQPSISSFDRKLELRSWILLLIFTIYCLRKRHPCHFDCSHCCYCIWHHHRCRYHLLNHNLCSILVVPVLEKCRFSIILVGQMKFFLWEYCNQVVLQSFFQKVVEIKLQHHFDIKKPFITPNFCDRNFWVWIFFVSKNHQIFGMKNRKCSKVIIFE